MPFAKADDNPAEPDVVLGAMGGLAFATAGTQRVTATETARPSVTGQSGPVTVQAAAAVRFAAAPVDLLVAVDAQDSRLLV